METRTLKSRTTGRRKAMRFRVTYAVEIQGKRIVYSKRTSHVRRPPPKQHGAEITTFSPSSRLRLLKKIASIDWSKITQGVFVTLTYPDEMAKQELRAMTNQRHNWIRYAENYLSAQTPILWCKEMQVRKTGVYTGMLVQHWHLCVFGATFLPHEMVNEWWRRTIKATGVLATDVRAMNTGEHAAFYLAKYLSKGLHPPYLDYVLKVSKPGRRWGIHRENLIPYHLVHRWDDITREEWELVARACMGDVEESCPLPEYGATVLGDRATDLAARIFAFLS